MNRRRRRSSGAALPRVLVSTTRREITRARIFDGLDPRALPILGDSDLATAIVGAISPVVVAPKGSRQLVGAHPSSRWNGLDLLPSRHRLPADRLPAGRWIVGRSPGPPEERAIRLRALADRAVGELAELEARLGRADDLERLFDEIEAVMLGPRSEKGSARGVR